jgi:P-type Ca2+ transporter type 2C
MLREKAKSDKPRVLTREELEKHGLSSDDAKKRLAEHGPNTLPEKPPPSSLSIFLGQFKNPLVYILVAAGFVTIFLRDFSDTIIIFFVVIVNSLLGFIQEKKASNALESLKALVHPEVDVIRDGKLQKIPIEEVVPGDIIDLDQGNKIPADGKLLHANRFLVEEAILTGESIPVDKKDGDEVFMGTIVSSGEALMEVTVTGANTQMGKIAESVQKPHEDTPLTKQIKKFSNQLTILVIILTAFVLVVGVVTGMELTEVFKTSVALAVSSIPEGLLIALTVVLAVGMQRILRKKGLVRNLVSAETLGGVTTICVDKTGTLTYGKLEVVDIAGELDKICIQHFASSDDPIMVSAKDWLKKKSDHFESIGKKFNRDCKIIDSIPFNPQNRYYATLVEHGDKNREVYVNGAPEVILQWATLPEKEKQEIHETIKELTLEGKRVIGMAKKDVVDHTHKISEKHIESKLTWVGLLIFTDPVREGISHSFEQTKRAGIKTIVITGDYAETASAVMRELKVDIAKDRIVLGGELEKMKESEVSELLKKLYKQSDGAILFARTKPEQKLKVITALKNNGEIVAMMGDGVNDAPALHKADIGIVVGDATDVAKESADLVLLDSSFETIVETIREGRGIFDNIRKIILYLMSDAYAEIVAVIGAILAGATVLSGLPLPITASQILWINIVSDGFPHLALTVDPKEKNIMNKPPRSSKSTIVANWMKILIGIVSVTSGLSALVLFIYYYQTSGDLTLARSVAFATLGLNSLVYVFSVRTLTQPFWDEDPLNNKWLDLAVIAGVLLQLSPFVFPPLRSFFETQMLSVGQWVSVLVASLIMFIIIEVSKLVFRHSAINQNL